MTDAHTLPAHTTLLIGFDSAWTPGNRGAIVAVLARDDGSLLELGVPRGVNFAEATAAIRAWQAELQPDATIVLLDQPTIVNNETGQRPVEHLVCSPVSARLGGMQPANRSRVEMFGDAAPVWPFLDSFGGAADPLGSAGCSGVFETYPVLAIIALGWLIPHTRARGRLPKYNPQRRETFSRDDWRDLCAQVSGALARHGLPELAAWSERARTIEAPRKHDQDALDACLCLLVALHLARGGECLMVGDLASGYIVVPHGDVLYAELEARCRDTGREPAQWLRRITARRARQALAARERGCTVAPRASGSPPAPGGHAMPFEAPMGSP